MLVELGDSVKKGDVLIRFYRPKIDKAIEEAKAKGDTASEARFRGYLDYAELKAPVDGVVLRIYRTHGDVPIDDLPVVTLADKSSYKFVVQVPDEVERLSMPLTSKFDVALEDEIGTVKGVVTDFEESVGDAVPVVLGLEPHDGLEEDLAGTVKVVSSRKEVGLVPRVSVIRRSDLAFLRVWDPESDSISEKSVLLGDDVGDDVIVLAGAFTGDSVVVPGRKREP